MQKAPPKVIAEIGCNHKGEMEIAKEMIMVASQFCKVDVVKFQKRTNKELLTPEEYQAPHPNPIHAYGDTYGEHREFLEFDLEQHRVLKACCEQWKVDYFVSTWDLTAAKQMAEISPRMIKIPSASNLDFELIRWLLEHFQGEIHVSLGMTTREEEKKIVELFESHKRLDDLVLYACTSGYPVPFEDVCLLEIKRLKSTYGGNIKGVGFSGHHLGIAADTAAMTLGVDYIERHFTLDRTWKGTDHAASLEPDGMRRVVRDVNHVFQALKYKDNEILEIENAQRVKLKRKL